MARRQCRKDLSVPCQPVPTTRAEFTPIVGSRCWGSDISGQAEPPVGEFTLVSAGGGHSCGLTASSTVRCWGDNVAAQSDSPVKAFTAVSVGSDHSCGLRAPQHH